jgi:hypothetical protein
LPVALGLVLPQFGVLPPYPDEAALIDWVIVPCQRLRSNQVDHQADPEMSFGSGYFLVLLFKGA